MPRGVCGGMEGGGLEIFILGIEEWDADGKSARQYSAGASLISCTELEAEEEELSVTRDI